MGTVSTGAMACNEFNISPVLAIKVEEELQAFEIESRFPSQLGTENVTGRNVQEHGLRYDRAGFAQSYL